MPRDPSGNYTLPALGNPAVSGTPITIAWWNGTGSDLAAAMTDSLSRTGSGGMLGPLGFVDGTMSLPGATFQSETNSGLYRSASFDVRMTIGGADTFKWVSSGPAALKTLTVTGSAGTAGILSIGGSGNADGGFFMATGAANGISATGGSGANSGLFGLAGSASGFGVSGAGVSGGVGVFAASSAANVDVIRSDGYISLANATNPAATTGFTNRVTPKNILKAYISMTTNGSGGFTVADAFNIDTGSISIGVPGTTIPFAAAMANTNYTVVGVAHTGQPLAFFVQTKNTTSVVIYVMTFAAPGTPLFPTTNSYGFEFAVYGAQ